MRPAIKRDTLYKQATRKIRPRLLSAPQTVPDDRVDGTDDTR